MKLAHYAVQVAILLFILTVGVGRASAQAPFQGSGYLQGYVYGLTTNDEMVPLVWANVTASNSNYHFMAATGENGTFGMFLPPGNYTLTVSSPGFKAYNATLVVSDGSDLSLTIYLYESGVPIPEFPVQVPTIAMIMILVAAALLTKRMPKRKR
jgi:hypothetical protein